MEAEEPASGLPAGACSAAVPCKETEPLFRPFIEVEGRVICFLDQDKRCACAKDLGVFADNGCDGEY